MEKGFKIFLLSVVLVITLVIFINFISAELISEQHGISQTTAQPSQTQKTGARIQTHAFGSANIVLNKVTFGSTSTGTTAYLQSVDGTILATANIVSKNASFNNYSLSPLTVYRITEDNNGSSFTQTRFQEVGRNFNTTPVIGNSFDWMGGYDNDGNLDINDDIFSVKAIYLNNDTGIFTSLVTDNISVTYNATIGENLFSLNGFFTFLGSSISRITKGWFTDIDSSNITTQNLQVNGQNVCLSNGINCPVDADIDVKSGFVNVTEGSCTSITFNTAFSSTPVAVGNVQNVSENNVVTIGSPSVSGFSLCLQKVGGGASSTYTTYWIATNAGNP